MYASSLMYVFASKYIWEPTVSLLNRMRAFFAFRVCPCLANSLSFIAMAAQSRRSTQISARRSLQMRLILLNASSVKPRERGNDEEIRSRMVIWAAQLKLLVVLARHSTSRSSQSRVVMLIISAAWLRGKG